MGARLLALATIAVAMLAYAASAASFPDALQLAADQKYVPNQGGNVAPADKPDCPSGTVGKWPVCIPTSKLKCPKDTIGNWPFCQKTRVRCPRGTRRVGKRCVDDHRCRKGWLRVGGRCIRVKKCPEGTSGKWPNCVPPGGRLEQAAPEPHCADGTVGKWPHCTEVREPCPEGEVRKNDVCTALPGTQRVGPAGTGQPPPTLGAPSSAAIPPAIAALTANRPHRDREIIVLVASANADQIGPRLARDYNVIADRGQPINLLGRTIVRLRLVDNRPLEPLLAALAADPDVELAQPNYEYEASEGRPAAATHLPQYAPAKLGLNEAHRLARGRGVKVAIIDTAIDTAHPELAGAVTASFRSSGEDGPKPEAHGTAIAGIVAARAMLTGTAPAAELLSVPAFRGGASSPARSTSLTLLKGIDWAFASGARVMNMSFTGPSDPLMERIVKAGANKGAVFVAAAGNGGSEAPPLYPAAYPEVMAVTATDERDALYTDANRGPYIAIAAPGVDIIVPSPGGAYDLKSGTSMAAAHVSGIIALMLERAGALNWQQVGAILSSSARMPKKDATAESLGAGVVDASRALSSL